MNDRSPVEQFDITGLFEFSETLPTLDEMRKIVLDIRPDLKVVMEAVDNAQTDHKLATANGSTDPTFGVDFGRNPPINAYFGASVNIPLCIFDKNRGRNCAPSGTSTAISVCSMPLRRRCSATSTPPT